MRKGLLLVTLVVTLGVLTACSAVVVPSTIPTPEPTRPAAAGDPAEGGVWAAFPTRTPFNEIEGADEGFIADLRGKYNQIGGKALIIDDILLIDDEEKKVLILRLSNDSAEVFAQQPEGEALAYAGALLDDALSYFGPVNLVVDVDELWLTRTAKDAAWWETECPYWCYVGDYNGTSDGWRIYHSYARGSYLHGQRQVETWNWR